MKIQIISGKTDQYILYIPGYPRVQPNPPRLSPIDDMKDDDLQTLHTNSSSCHNTYGAIHVTMDREDYLDPIDQIVKQLGVPNCILVVAHSLGCLYALKIAALYPHIYNKLLLIDPVVKCPEYHEYLSKNYPERLQHYNLLPDHTDIKSKIIIRIHYNYTTENSYKIPHLYKLVNKNTQSQLILYDNVGHILHRRKSENIMNSIEELLRI